MRQPGSSVAVIDVGGCTQAARPKLGLAFAPSGIGVPHRGVVDGTSTMMHKDIPSTTTMYWSPEFVARLDGPAGGAESFLVEIEASESTVATVIERDPGVSASHDLRPVILTPGGRIPESRIELEERIGTGATAVVFSGRHVDLDRPLAIKVLKRGATWYAARDRFLAEARLTSELDSPYVVDVIDFGTLPDGRMWSAMELLDGHPLSREIADGPLPPARTIALLRMACKGLHAAHTAGIVHRDVKPDNMMLTDRNGREHLVLVDFGIATVGDPDEDERCGTPRYMPPEQIVAGMSVDGRADLYALGCCAYEMLTGKLLVDEQTVEEALEAHVHGVEPKFGAAPQIPAGLQSVVRRCLSSNPDDRYTSAAELEAALCEVQLEAELMCATDVLPVPQLPDAERRRRLAHALTGLRMGARKSRPVGVAAAALLAFSMVAMGFAETEPHEVESSLPHIAEQVVRSAMVPSPTAAVSHPNAPTSTARAPADVAPQREASDVRATPSHAKPGPSAPARPRTNAAQVAAEPRVAPGRSAH